MTDLEDRKLENDASTWAEMREVSHQIADHAAMFGDLGAFIAHFAIAELVLSRVLMAASRVRDPAIFDVLCRGLDPRGKVERLIKAAKRQGGMGPKLRGRLSFFERKIIPIRNIIAHSSIVPSIKQPGTYLAFGVANPPLTDWDEIPSSLYLSDCETLTSDYLVASGYWLSDFTDDLAKVEPLALRLAWLEVDHPSSPLPPSDNPHLDPRDDLTTYRRLQSAQKDE